MNQKLLLTIVVMLFTAGCSTNAVRLWDVGARFEQHNEAVSPSLSAQLSQQTGTTVTMTSGNNNKLIAQGYGLQVGYSEYIGKLVSRLSLYYAQLGQFQYNYFIPSTGGSLTQTVLLSVVGFEGSIGYQFWHVRPQISYKYEGAIVNSAVGLSTPTSATAWSFYLGGGLAGEIPLSEKLRVILAGDYRIPLKLPSNVTGMESWTAQASIQFGAHEWK